MLSDKDSLKKSLDIIQQFSETAGPILNLNKSEIIATGKYKYEKSICGINVTDSVNCLGIYIGNDKRSCQVKNWDEKINKLESTLNTWKKRNLTMFGVVTIIRALVISKIVYSVQNTFMPSGIVNKIDKILYNFVWKNKERIKRKILIRKIKDGGINMLDVNSFF